MSRSEAFEQILRISPLAPTDIDDLIYGVAPRDRDAGRDLFTEDTATAFPGAAEEQEQPALGIRVSTPLDDPSGLAMKLATLAVERDVEVVILSHLDYCGLERFGFRVERIAGATEAAQSACEAEVKWFWSLGVVL